MKFKRIIICGIGLAITACFAVINVSGGFSLAVAQEKAAAPAVNEEKAKAAEVQEKKEDAAGKEAAGDRENNESAQSAPKEAESDSLWNWFKKGGMFMWPILFCAALGLGFIIERLVFFFRNKFAPREFIDELERSIAGEDMSVVETMCAQSNNKIGHIIYKGLQFKSLGYERVEKAMSVAGSVEVSRMERGLSVLNAVANIAPMLGFLGTVSGMISAFYQIAAADQVSAKIVAAGIMEALITTETGLIVAIPVLLVYNYFIHRIDGFISDVERLSTDVIERFIKGKEFGGQQG